MNKYAVTGTDRQVGAIGIMESFSITVNADDDEAARQAARDARYAANREHVLCMDVRLIRPGGGTRKRA